MERKSIPFLLILAATAAACSRLIFFLIADPQGPNLLVVAGMAAGLFALSLAAWFTKPLALATGPQRVAAVLPVQIMLAVAAYILLR